MRVSVPGTLYNIVNRCGKSDPHPVLIIAYFPDPGPDMDLCLFPLIVLWKFFSLVLHLGCKIVPQLHA